MTYQETLREFLLRMEPFIRVIYHGKTGPIPYFSYVHIWLRGGAAYVKKEATQTFFCCDITAKRVVKIPMSWKYNEKNIVLKEARLAKMERMFPGIFTERLWEYNLIQKYKKREMVHIQSTMELREYWDYMFFEVGANEESARKARPK